MSSLKEQLLKAGLVTKHDAQKKLHKKTPTKPKKNRKKVSDSTLRVQRAMLDKAKKDKKLNEQRKAKAEKKQLMAQIKQLVASSKLDRSEGETTYHFTFKKKVKSLYVTEQQQTQLSHNQIAIIHLQEELFELVPKKVAEKIAERDSSSVIKNENVHESETTTDDPYADYQIPDDLVW